MAGANYADHLFDMMRAQDPNVTIEQVKERSRERGIGGFWKMPSFVADPEQDIIYPERTRFLDYEGEVTVVIGKSAKDAKGGDLLDHIGATRCRTTGPPATSVTTPRARCRSPA
jgi:2-keto-4-pentenoate hydratase/2-oxohepta-3-ene-1,7-dioic acid hydratase in catechol pathway